MSGSTRCSLLLTLALLVLARPAPAEAPDERAAIERFFAATEISREWFAESFLELVPFEQIPALRTQMTAPLGAFEEVRRDGDRWLALFESGSIPTLAQLDAEGRFVGLRLLPPVKRVQVFEELVEQFETMPGEGALLVVVEGEERLAHRADHPYAVGSAFKFVVLRALLQAVEDGHLAWDQVISLRAEDRSLPSGFLEQWPVAAPLTLHTLAALMISQSDNTATDTLIHALGREAVEAADPAKRNRPFLTTREAFLLKDDRNDAWLARWRSGDEEEKRTVLVELADRPLPSAAIFSAGPLATDVEWYLTARELCQLASELQGLDLVTINPGVVSKSHFERVAFKGGSEPGVLNLTTWVRTLDGREACVCATRIAEVEVDTSELAGIVASAFDLVRQP